MIKPPVLKEGDKIRIVIPASPVKPEFFEPGMRALQQLGFQPVYSNDVYRKWRYLAGRDDIRRVELLEALQDTESKAIFFARGGYGSIRLLTADLGGILPPKILLGCSDITTLHLYFQRMQNWTVFHGPMASGDFARAKADLHSFHHALMQSEPYSLTTPERIETLREGDAEGILLGGCLTLLHSSIGTPWEPDWRNSILFLEDVATKPYQIDRMLTHLKLLGKFNEVSAFIFGEMKDCVQIENQGYSLQEVLLDILGDLGKPIYYNFPSGHVSGMNWTLPFGVQAKINGKPFRLDIREGAVSAR
jgi:muramoyltetrapeptide carboxypeptidase